MEKWTNHVTTPCNFTPLHQEHGNGYLVFVNSIKTSECSVFLIMFFCPRLFLALLLCFNQCRKLGQSPSKSMRLTTKCGLRGVLINIAISSARYRRDGIRRHCSVFISVTRSSIPYLMWWRSPYLIKSKQDRIRRRLITFRLSRTHDGGGEKFIPSQMRNFFFKDHVAFIADNTHRNFLDAQW